MRLSHCTDQRSVEGTSGNQEPIVHVSVAVVVGMFALKSKMSEEAAATAQDVAAAASSCLFGCTFDDQRLRLVLSEYLQPGDA